MFQKDELSVGCMSHGCVVTMTRYSKYLSSVSIELSQVHRVDDKKVKFLENKIIYYQSVPSFVFPNGHIQTTVEIQCLSVYRQIDLLKSLILDISFLNKSLQL